MRELILFEALQEIQELNHLDNKTTLQRLLKFNEEFGEFAAELGKLEGITHKEYNVEHLVEEMADSLQCHFSLMLDICERENIDFLNIIKTIKFKNQKWRSKIPEYKNNE